MTLTQEFLRNTNANILAPQYRKIPCMTIGEILKALKAEEGLKLEAIAARVRAAGAPEVKYQHLQHLINGGTRTPAFLPALAKAFGMTVEQFLAWKPGTNREPMPEYGTLTATQPASSHPVQLDPETLASSYQLVRLAHKAMNLEFDPETASDAHIVLLGYAYLKARAEQVVTPDNLVDFTEYLRKRQARGSHEDERSSSTRSTSPGARRKSA